MVALNVRIFFNSWSLLNLKFHFTCFQRCCLLKVFVAAASFAKSISISLVYPLQLFFGINRKQNFPVFPDCWYYWEPVSCLVFVTVCFPCISRSMDSVHRQCTMHAFTISNSGIRSCFEVLLPSFVLAQSPVHETLSKYCSCVWVVSLRSGCEWVQSAGVMNERMKISWNLFSALFSSCFSMCHLAQDWKLFVYMTPINIQFSMAFLKHLFLFKITDHVDNKLLSWEILNLCICQRLELDISMCSKGHRDTKIFFILESQLNPWQGKTGTHFLTPVEIWAFQLWRENRSP